MGKFLNFFFHLFTIIILSILVRKPELLFNVYFRWLLIVILLFFHICKLDEWCSFNALFLDRCLSWLSFESFFYSAFLSFFFFFLEIGGPKRYLTNVLQGGTYSLNLLEGNWFYTEINFIICSCSFLAAHIQPVMMKTKINFISRIMFKSRVPPSSQNERK